MQNQGGLGGQTPFPNQNAGQGNPQFPSAAFPVNQLPAPAQMPPSQPTPPPMIIDTDPHRGKKSKLQLIIMATLGVMAAALLVAFFWAYSQMNSAKTDRDSTIATAVEQAKAEQKTASEADFAVQLKIANETPYSTWTAPNTFAGVSFQYPRNWSAYYKQDGTDQKNYYILFHPNAVPTDNDNTPYALRLNVVVQDYANYIGQFQNNDKLRISPVTINGHDGIRVDGQFRDTINGTKYIFPVRNETVIIGTDLQDFQGSLADPILTSFKMNE
jgi:hypothetical protein